MFFEEMNLQLPKTVPDTNVCEFRWKLCWGFGEGNEEHCKSNYFQLPEGTGWSTCFGRVESNRNRLHQKTFTYLFKKILSFDAGKDSMCL